MTTPSRWTAVAALLVGALVTFQIAPAADSDQPGPAGKVRFNHDLRPILSDNCFACHGPDPATRKAGRRFDTEDGLFAAKDGVTPVVKGKPQESELYLRIMAEDASERMPPAKSHKKLTDAQKELVRRWIEEGAAWEPHWSLVKPARPELPAVKNLAWVKNPIDRLVLAKLEETGLTPAAEADRRTLIRRVTFDLIGLPPTPAEVEAFVNDPSPNGYEKVVDRLLASAHYGEHRGRYWLDYARYADTHGLHIDNYREMWPYRDWVIRAFNENKHFDQFTVEQLGGDLLPQRTLDQVVGSGFNRCNITTNEGGAISEEYLVLYARDRVETTAQVWLGMTAGCAVCHDHKFDPLSTRDFYSLAAFFNNTTQNAMDGNIKDTPPILFVPRNEDREKWESLARMMADVRGQIDARKATGKAEFDAWLAQ